MAEVSDLMMTHRLVTLAGIGGIGKTRLGLEVARQLLPRFSDGVWIAELGFVRSGVGAGHGRHRARAVAGRRIDFTP